MLKAFRALPTEPRARALKRRDILYCTLNQWLDEEETLDALCPACRERAQEKRCTCCGAPLPELRGGAVNPSFDLRRFYELKEGHIHDVPDRD